MHPERRPSPDRSPEPLEARLRALPQPPVPPGLEARLLATVPAAMPAPRRRWGVWVGMAGALAAACLLAALAWPERDGQGPGPETNATSPPVTPRTPDAAGVASLGARRNPDGAETTIFTWPVEETSPLRVSTAIYPDLLD